MSSILSDRDIFQQGKQDNISLLAHPLSNRCLPEIQLLPIRQIAQMVTTRMGYRLGPLLQHTRNCSRNPTYLAAKRPLLHHNQKPHKFRTAEPPLPDSILNLSPAHTKKIMVNEWLSISMIEDSMLRHS